MEDEQKKIDCENKIKEILDQYEMTLAFKETRINGQLAHFQIVCTPKLKDNAGN